MEICQDRLKRFTSSVGYTTYLAVKESGKRPAITAMALYSIPPNTGKVRVAMFLGGKFAVWNGKSGQHEFRILCKDRKQAIEVAGIINKKQHDGSIEVLG